MGDLFDLKGKTAVITGSSRGIGAAMAMRLAEFGANVVVSSRDQAACEATARKIVTATRPGAAVGFAAHVGSKDALAALVARAEYTYGKVDIAICNAASNPFMGTMDRIPDGVFTKVLQNNVISVQWLINRVLPGMRARRDGTIIITSSIGGLRGGTMIGAYQTSKAATVQMARNLAIELGPDNIRVNTIAPGLVRTEFARALWESPEEAAKTIARVPLGRLGEPDDIAGMAVLLASPAGAWITGQTFVVDGGTTA
ncbi:MAG: SDR family oxidoreductase [Pseudomonadota bacterium]